MNNGVRSLLILLAISILISSCTSGGGGTTTGPARPTRAVVKLSSQGTTTATINGLKATLQLPAGVSVKATVSAPQIDDGVVTASGAAANADLVVGTYSASQHTVNLSIVSSGGVGIGEFATINCDIEQGSSPAATDFTISNLSAWDTNGAPIAGMSASLTATIK